MPVMEITTRIGCRVSCSYCPQDNLLRAYKERSSVYEMSFDLFKACLDKIPLEVDIIFAGMSEPMLNQECRRMISYANKKGYKITLDTTMLGMKLEDIDFFESIPFKFFSVHLPSKEGYEKIAIDKDYLKLLDKISHSKIKVFFKFHGKNIHPEIRQNLTVYIDWAYTTSRARNIKMDKKAFTNRLKGVIGCKRNLHWNVLLPNGDVVLCSSDYSLRHILGNLLTSDYNSLFTSKEFLAVKNGLRDSSQEILCRYCDRYTYNINLIAKLYNSVSCLNMLMRNSQGPREIINLARKSLAHKFSRVKQPGQW